MLKLLASSRGGEDDWCGGFMAMWSQRICRHWMIHQLARSVRLEKRTNRYLVSLLNVVIHLLHGEKSWQRSVSGGGGTGQSWH